MPSDSVRSVPAGTRRALFVDRDGTLDPDLHYLKEATRLELFRGVGRALRLARGLGRLVICITNQSGVERGLYSSADVEAIHARLNERLAAEGAHVDAFYYCPHAPEHHCACRKPGTLLFEQARDDWRIEMATSAMVGDRGLDVAAGRTLSMTTALVRSRGHEAEVAQELASLRVRPDVSADTFEAAVVRVLALG
jgi:D-glycero-D-manno-heptose 1,7-bisphosphate phosphatase